MKEKGTSAQEHEPDGHCADQIGQERRGTDLGEYEGGEHEDAGPNHQIDDVGGEMPRPDRSDQSGVAATVRGRRCANALRHWQVLTE